MDASCETGTGARGRTLSHADITEGVRRATSCLPKWYPEATASGMTDEELTAALQRVLGIHGGSGARDCIHVEYQGAGLKIWVSWATLNNYGRPPTIQGQRTVDLVRMIYAIPDPSNAQASLF